MLKEKVIKFLNDLMLKDTERNALLIDGVDKKTWERKTETLNMDRKNYTKKHGHGGLKYQIVLCALRQQCCHIYGPVRGGMYDREMLKHSKVLGRLTDGKIVNVDRGYIEKKWSKYLSWPNPQNLKEVNNFKSRIRLRHETFNGRMAFFGCMSQTWSHTIEKHGLAFRAVAVTVQYQMNNGSPLFDV